MKRLSGLLMVFLLVVATGIAGEGKMKYSSEKRGDGKISKEEKMDRFHTKRLEFLTEKLSLTPEQKEEISKILKEGWEEIKLERKKMREKVKAIKEAIDQKIETLLTPQQKITFNKIKNELTERRKTRKMKKCKGEHTED